MVLSTQIVALLYPRVGPRRLMAAGLTGVAIMMSLLCLVGSDTSLWLMRMLMFLIGAGMAYAFLPMQAAAFATITPTATGRASAIYNAQRQLGAAFGVAVLSSVLSIVGPTSRSVTGTVQPNLAAYHAAFLTAAGFALIGACIALTVHDSDAAVTMQRRGRQSRREDIPEQTQRAEVLS